MKFILKFLCSKNLNLGGIIEGKRDWIKHGKLLTKLD